MVPAAAPALNPAPAPETFARPGGHPDPRLIDMGPTEGFDFEAELDALHREQTIDFGDDAVNADAAGAEATLLTRYPAVTYVSLTRHQRRYRKGAGNAGEFEASWFMFVQLGGQNFSAVEEPTADAALAVVLKQLAALAAGLNPAA